MKLRNDFKVNERVFHIVSKKECTIVNFDFGMVFCCVKYDDATRKIVHRGNLRKINQVSKAEQDERISLWDQSE